MIVIEMVLVVYSERVWSVNCYDSNINLLWSRRLLEIFIIVEHEVM